MSSLDKLAALKARTKPATVQKQSNSDLLAKFKKTKNSPAPAATKLSEVRAAEVVPLDLPSVAVPELDNVQSGTRVEKHEITYELLNDEQKQAVDYAIEGQSFCLIGSAGTGKTTTQRVVMEQLERSGAVHMLENFNHRYLPKNCMSIMILSFVNKAVNNIRATLPDRFKPNAITIHKALEYAPEKVLKEVVCEDTGIIEEKEVLQFLPARCAANPIKGLTHIVIEESSTVSIELFEKLLDALPNRGKDICFIFLGDLKQLLPVFGLPILANKLREHEYVELTKVYRQALDSPIKKLAIDVNEGRPIGDVKLREEYEDGTQLKLVNFSGKKPDGSYVKREDPEWLVEKLANHFISKLKDGSFEVFRDIILCSFRVNHNQKNDINCQYLNLLIAEAMGQHRNAEVHEVVSGYERLYLAVGDPIIYNKEEWEIISIKPNEQYKGVPAKFCSVDLDRWGNYRDDQVSDLDFDMSDEHTEAILNLSVTPSDDEDESIVNAASHCLELRFITKDPTQERIIVVNNSGELNDIDFAYATTVHKAIGSEWDSVFFILHHSHQVMLSRELVYTGITRAKNHLTIYYDGQNHAKKELNSSTISKAIMSPQIKGVTIKEKLEWLELKDKKDKDLSTPTEDLMAKFKKKA